MLALACAILAIRRLVILVHNSLISCYPRLNKIIDIIKDPISKPLLCEIRDSLHR